MSSPFGRTLPPHPDLAQQKKQADVERMHEALQHRDAQAMRTLFQSSAELRAQIDVPAFPFDSPAIVAFADDPTIVEVLLEFGADPNKRSNWWAGGFHALHQATGRSAELLLAGGAVPDACAAANLDRAELLARMIADDPSRVHERGGDGKTPLHFARSREVVDLLLAAGADIDARDVDHRSTAAEHMLDRTRGEGRYELARHLVERGATADIFLASALGLRDRVAAMVRTAPALLDLRTGQGPYGAQPPSSYHIYFWTIGNGRSPLDTAAQFEQPETLEVMMERATPLQRLLVACRLGDVAQVRAVLREHPRALESATPADRRALADAAWNSEATTVATMLEAGFDPRTPGHDSGTALHCAAWAGSAAAVAALLRHRDARALLDIRDAHYGATPLGWCCHGSLHGDTSRDHATVAKLLLEAGAVPGPDSTRASELVEAEIARWRRSH